MALAPRPMRIAVALLAPVAAAILATWWWLGAPVALPAAPLGPGEKLYCMSYSPFRGRQTPLVVDDAAQVLGGAGVRRVE